MDKSYTCAQCKKTHEKGWSDEEALAEKDKYFPAVDLADCALICDDCWKQVMGIHQDG